MSLRLQIALLLSLLVAACNAQVPSNDACSNAVDLTTFITVDPDSPVIVQGSTTESTNDGVNLCGVTGASKRGIWYLYQDDTMASTTIVTVSTCTDVTNFDTALTLYSGFCTNLMCVNGADNDLECDTGDGQHTTISWHAAPSTRYYLLVHGSHVNHTGTFGLTVTTVEPLSTNPPSGAYSCSRGIFWWSTILGLSSFALALF